ncbi:MAG TPA: inactive serine/threonine-protein kinase VRK3 [Ktedonobacteraceae bacterium]|nr:inactive serine/threonine-protein kinase VRK3 [Ktedonobacteraceae bacterium]
MAQPRTEQDFSGLINCPQCNATLPSQALFCSSCGARIDKADNHSLLEDDIDIATRYRITSLVRRQPYVTLFFAYDNQQQRPVAIRDLDLNDVNEEARNAIKDAVKDEYDLLRRQRIPYTMPVVDLRYFQNHLYLVTGWLSGDTPSQLHTLNDLLQSGAGLPNEQVTLDWMTRLCFSLEYLHRQNIVIGGLDPQAIVLNEDSYQSQLALMVSWLPTRVRGLLPCGALSTQTDPFMAPEALEGNAEARSDLYSIGAIFYLLLTGQAPEDATTRQQHPTRSLRSPRDLNPRVSNSVDELVTRALALDLAERFQNASAMIAALTDVDQKRPASRLTQVKAAALSGVENEAEDENWYLEETVTITPLKQARTPGSASTAPSSTNAPADAASQESRAAVEEIPTQAIQPAPFQGDIEHDPFAIRDTEAVHVAAPPAQDQKQSQRWRKRVTALLPIIGTGQQSPVEKAPLAKESLWLKRLREFFLGEQQHTTTAAAIIETPMRVQPNQPYAIRIRLMGRSQPAVPPTPGESLRERRARTPQGLSALVEGEVVYIEVRSVLYQSFAYIVQQAAVAIPAPDYAADVTIPMQAISSGPSGRRDRLHIFFLDKERRPLYEKPFVVEIFVSHLVQSGREGHNVLTIPL